MQHMKSEMKHAAAETEGGAAKPMPPLAKIRLLYESRDRRMCLFEDAQGHLVAAPSNRLA